MSRMDLRKKDIIVVVQCDISKQRCSGYNCDHAFQKRSGGFADYPADRTYRTIHMTCSGCCGRALQRKLSNLIRQAKRKDGIDPDRIVVQLSSCITKENFHGPPCPHIEYLKKIIDRVGLDWREDTVIFEKSEQRRKAGIYADRPRETSDDRKPPA